MVWLLLSVLGFKQIGRNSQSRRCDLASVCVSGDSKVDGQCAAEVGSNLGHVRLPSITENWAAGAGGDGARLPGVRTLQSVQAVLGALVLKDPAS